MKTFQVLFILILVALIPQVVYAQELDLEWYETNKVEIFRWQGEFVQVENGTIYRMLEVKAGWRGYFIPTTRLIQKLDNQLEVSDEIEIDLRPAGKNANVMCVFYDDEKILVLVAVYNSNESRIVLKGLTLNADNLTISEPFVEVASLEGVVWSSNEARDYPIFAFLSPDKQLVAIKYQRKFTFGTRFLPQLYDSEYSSIIINNELETVMEFDTSPSVMKFDAESKRIYGLTRNQDNGRIRVESFDLFNESNESIEFESEYFWRPWSGYHGNPFFFSYRHDKDGAVLGLIDPENESSQILVNLTEDHISQFKNREYNPFAGRFINYDNMIKDIFKTPEGDYIVTIEFSSKDEFVFRHDNSINTTFICGNITSLCFNEQGNVLWIQSIPKFQKHEVPRRILDETYMRFSAEIFRDDNGIHFIYNEGENNLSISNEDKPRPYIDRRAGNGILAHASITNSGELTREILYELSEDKMWLNLSETTRVSDQLFVMMIYYRNKERLGLLRISD